MGAMAQRIFPIEVAIEAAWNTIYDLEYHFQNLQDLKMSCLLKLLDTAPLVWVGCRTNLRYANGGCGSNFLKCINYFGEKYHIIFGTTPGFLNVKCNKYPFFVIFFLWTVYTSKLSPNSSEMVEGSFINLSCSCIWNLLFLQPLMPVLLVLICGLIKGYKYQDCWINPKKLSTLILNFLRNKRSNFLIHCVFFSFYLLVLSNANNQCNFLYTLLRSIISADANRNFQQLTRDLGSMSFFFRGTNAMLTFFFENILSHSRCRPQPTHHCRHSLNRPLPTGRLLPATLTAADPSPTASPPLHFLFACSLLLPFHHQPFFSEWLTVAGHSDHSQSITNCRPSPLPHHLPPYPLW
ncbi:hypothetical protein VP01_1639g7 [Puccinia sorghi]|uniref:Uncharacterized protein n=1 Tax=Puccinia sorghi TaxID=27349 RepID=A0A0L6VIK8_9BASI|nr:hypothetical protein VP01_1639g7 [Puccinia sorghi]